jgi:hypothetical protein
MDTMICDSMYKDIKAVTIENDILKAQFTPEFGGKMVSLVYKPSGREFLRQSSGAFYKTLKYDGDYVKAECSGFDDMFPTIDRAIYADHPWNGVQLPDHGEVCSLKWNSIKTSESIQMSVYGVRLPYRLEKQISLYPENSLLIKYKAANLSAFDMDFIWAGHMMIDAGTGGEIIMPYKEDHEARIVFTDDPDLGSYGDTVVWPAAADRKGKIRAINTIKCSNDDISTLKYYFKGRLPEGRCGFRYKDGGIGMDLTFPENAVPYFGILISREHGLILEPCTGTMDRPDMAKLFGQRSILPAGGTYSWFLTISAV